MPCLAIIGTIVTSCIPYRETYAEPQDSVPPWSDVLDPPGLQLPNEREGIIRWLVDGPIGLWFLRLS